MSLSSPTPHTLCPSTRCWFRVCVMVAGSMLISGDFDEMKVILDYYANIEVSQFSLCLRCVRACVSVFPSSMIPLIRCVCVCMFVCWCVCRCC